MSDIEFFNNGFIRSFVIPSGFLQHDQKCDQEYQKENSPLLSESVAQLQEEHSA